MNITLLDTVKVDDENDLPGLRLMIDRLVSDLRAPETIGVQSDAFAVLLLPVLKTKIPESWRLEWLRKCFDVINHDHGKHLETLQTLNIDQNHLTLGSKIICSVTLRASTFLALMARSKLPLRVP